MCREKQIIVLKFVAVPTVVGILIGRYVPDTIFPILPTVKKFICDTTKSTVGMFSSMIKQIRDKDVYFLTSSMIAMGFVCGLNNLVKEFHVFNHMFSNKRFYSY